MVEPPFNEADVDEMVLMMARQLILALETATVIKEKKRSPFSLPTSPKSGKKSDSDVDELTEEQKAL